jgi:hypothetical protein
MGSSIEPPPAERVAQLSGLLLHYNSGKSGKSDCDGAVVLQRLTSCAVELLAYTTSAGARALFA